MKNKNKAGVGKTVLITGASSGIGLALANEFAEQGFDLALTARNREQLEAIAQTLIQRRGVQVRVFSQDLSRPEGPEQLAAAIRKIGLDIHVLVNNAGFGDSGNFATGDWEIYSQMLQLNIASLAQLTRLFLPQMLRRKNGKILNVGSTGSFAPVPYMAMYGATKAFVLSFTEALAAELVGTGVTAMALCPGVTITHFAQRAKVEKTLLFRLGAMQPQTVARIGYRALMRGKIRVIPGWFNKMLVASVRFTPRDSLLQVSKMLMRTR